jgi:hypothetical protein
LAPAIGEQRRTAATHTEVSAASSAPPDHASHMGGTMSRAPRFDVKQAREIGERIGIEWASARFDVEQFRMGLEVELEHGRHDPTTDVTGDDPLTTGRIALAHLNEFPDYYTRLARMEAEAEAEAEGGA